MRIVIGDKNLSSWSLRPWLVLKRTGVAFDEIVIRLDKPDTTALIKKHSPTGLVPAIGADDGLALWDSLAIAEYLAETHPAAKLWPADPTTRALARAAACEMHSGFAALRQQCPMNLKRRVTVDPSPQTAANLRRLVDLFGDLRSRFADKGPYLVGEWSIADAFYTPVAARLRHFQIDLADYGDDGTAGAYAASLLAQPDFRLWEAEALA